MALKSNYVVKDVLKYDIVNLSIYNILLINFDRDLSILRPRDLGKSESAHPHRKASLEDQRSPGVVEATQICATAHKSMTNRFKRCTAQDEQDDL